MARKGEISEEMEMCARQVGVPQEFFRKGVEEGTIVAVGNKKHASVLPLAIGKGLKTKVNVNIGTSGDHMDGDLELEKVKIAEPSGADTIMDLSTGGDVSMIRREIIKEAA